MAKRSEREWLSLVDSWDRAIQQGRQSEVREALLSLPGDRIPPSVRARVANLSWRTDVPHVGASVLHPVVREAARCSAAEASEYAGCLVRLGAAREAEKLAASVSPAHYPRALLYLAFARAFRRDFAGSIEALWSFLKENREPAHRPVALLNLAAALLHEERYKEAAVSLEEILEISPRSQHLVRASAVHLTAAILFLQGDDAEASEFIAFAAKQLSARISEKDFVVRKWRAVAGVRRNPSETSVEKLLRIRDEAFRLKDHETVRECDRFEAIATGDKDLFLYVYFGTPYPEFRARLCREFGPVEIPDVFLWQEGDDPPLDPFGLWGDDPMLEPGGLAYLTLAGLCEDFYRPRSSAGLYPSLFPRRFFHPKQTPETVREGIRQVRMALIDFDADVVEQQDNYRLLLRGENFIVPRPREDRPPVPLALVPFLQQWGDKPFTVNDVKTSLGVARELAVRLVKEAQDGGAVVGAGKKQTFRLVSTGGSKSPGLKRIS